MRVFLVLFTLSLLISCQEESNKVLVFTETAGYHHSSIDDGIMAIKKLGKSNNFGVDVHSESEVFEEEIIKNYRAIIFLSTTGDVLDKSQESVLERYIQAGGGFVGIHAATDTEYDWPWYNKLVGAYFSDHPSIQEARLNINDYNHPSTQHLGKEWIHEDEWYNFKSINPDTKKLISIDETSYSGGKQGENHAVCWYHEYDGGRSWYTALGHTKESFKDETFLKHLLGGIQYAMITTPLDYSKAKSNLVPVANRFGLNRLIEGVLIEPTEMTILPNEDVIIIQRRGEIIRYYAASNSYKKIGKLDVYFETDVPDVNAEEGLMGLTKDPKFDTNGFIYLFYSPKNKPVNRLSRFYIDQDSLHMGSEKMILEVESDRDICCHTGGSLAFSADGKHLFISTGDNATPFDEKGSKYVNNGYSPQDNRPGHEQYDARRSSANTNDLRGKILRITIEDDATYTIPEGNLFPVGTELTRPEIYVMGTRNPYRISIDQKNGDLFWGDVGPDAASADSDRGPMGHDEINRATEAGNHGWPLFVGDNKAYSQYDYKTGKSGPKHDAVNPVNLSRNNTGLKTLPPAKAALIYYPYDKSEIFPSLKSGGRNAMAGPVYYTDLYPKSSVYPEHFNGKLFIYDWIRQWIKIVDLDKNGKIKSIADFMPESDFANIIDMEVGPNGQIYILEYGKGWFSKNPDASLTRIDYNSGNRAPKIMAFQSDKQAGQIPLNIQLSIEAKDPENEKLTYDWFKNGTKLEGKESAIAIIIDEIGQSIIKCQVNDEFGNKTESSEIIINSGNELAKIDIKIEGNQTFFFKGQKIEYEIKVNDDQDFDQKNIMIKHELATYNSNIGHLNSAVSSLGEKLIESSDCASCHKKSEASIGPSYEDIAIRYQDLNYAMAFLGEKIRKGGSGNWGEGAMAAHPAISEAESLQIADWILSLNKEEIAAKSLDLKGAIYPKIDPKENWKNTSYLRVSYSDFPTNGAKPLTVNSEFKLRPNYYEMANVQRSENMQLVDFFSTKVIKIPNEESKLQFDNIDLTEIKNIRLDIKAKDSKEPDLIFELLNKDQEPIATSEFKSTRGTFHRFVIPIPRRTFSVEDYTIRINKKDKDQELSIAEISFDR